MPAEAGVKTESSLNLRAVRNASERTLPEVTEAFGYLNTKHLCEFEVQTDWKLSRLSKFLQACGATAKITVEINGQIFEFPL